MPSLSAVERSIILKLHKEEKFSTEQIAQLRGHAEKTIKNIVCPKHKPGKISSAIKSGRLFSRLGPKKLIKAEEHHLRNQKSKEQQEHERILEHFRKKHEVIEPPKKVRAIKTKEELRAIALKAVAKARYNREHGIPAKKKTKKKKEE